MDNELHECSPENAEKMLDWIRNRGGIAIWQSINIGNSNQSWSTPADRTDGKPMTKPTWQADIIPARIITDPKEVVVITRKEVKRFRIAIRRGDGLSFVLTDHSSKKVKAALFKYGEESSYHFEDGEAVITVPDQKVLLSEWKKEG
jgi:hypothetical protein